MKSSVILFSGLGLGSIAVTGAGSYLLVQKFSEESIKFSGKLSFSKKESVDEEKQEIYEGKLSFDTEHVENDEKCEIKELSIFCNFSNLTNKKIAEKLLEKLEAQETIYLFKDRFQESEIKSEFESSFGLNFYKKLINIFNDWNIKNFKGWLIFSFEAKSASSTKPIVSKLLLSEKDDSTTNKKIAFKIPSYVDRTKVEKYAEEFSFELDEDSESKFKEKLKEHLEDTTNKTKFEDAFSEEILKNLISFISSSGEVN